MSTRFVPLVLYQEVAERIRERIYNHELKPGEWIDEQVLAQSFGLSRTPLREALKVLNSEGLVVLKPRRGCFVAELTEQDLDEIFPVMALLEGRCAYDAVRKAKPHDIKRLDGIHAKLEEFAAAGDINRYYEQNYIFHDTVQKLAGNLWLQKTVSDLRKFLKLLRGRQLRLPGRMEASLEEHRMVMAAFHNRDPAGAEKILHDHLMAQRVALAVYDAQEAGRAKNLSERKKDIL
jgi:DNA-binding GntR family transcriptional regulator